MPQLPLFMLNESAGGTLATRVGVPSVGVPLSPAGQVQPPFPPPEPPELPPPPVLPPVVLAPPEPPEPPDPPAPVVEVPAPVLLPVVADVVLVVPVAAVLVAVAVVVSNGPGVVLEARFESPLVWLAVVLGLPVVVLAVPVVWFDEVSSEPQAADIAKAPSASKFEADRYFIDPQ